jgi:LPS sulfotransferase NodH
MMIYIGEFAWESYFREHKIVPFVIIYENFFHDLDRQLRALIEYLGGLPPGRAYMDRDLTYKIQRNKESYAMRERFISDLNRIGERRMLEELGKPCERWTQFFFQYGWNA